jgi:hypothetical protein
VKLLGIFGDSSASPNLDFNHSWVELLEKEYEFENFAVQGSSLLYTYSQLMAQGNKFENLIVFVAPVGRVWAPNCKIQQHFVNQLTVERYENSSGHADKNILNAVKLYFNNLWLYEKEQLQQRAIVDSIRINFPNALLIPVTPHSIYDWPTDKICMHYISLLDYEYHNVHEYTPDWGRTCHMNKENNKIFFTVIKNWLVTKKFDMTIDMFKYPVETKEELFPKNENRH